MSNVVFEDFSVRVKDVIKDKALAYLDEAGGEIEAVTKRNTRVDTEQTKGSFRHQLFESELKCSIGSDYENAVWEEFGTGIYAFNGDGRKTPWLYVNRHGEGRWTRGKKPQRMLFNAYQSSMSVIRGIAERIFGEIG